VAEQNQCTLGGVDDVGCGGDDDEVVVMGVWCRRRRGDRDEGGEVVVGVVEMTWGNDGVGSK
ncbi:hypothetical protein Tco_0521557, partial [Tanacetum coccineum]